jgi:hypothetical protein
MKLILILLFFSPSAFAIELVLNGMTYHISNYAIHNNGQKIVIDHKGISNKQTNCKKVKINNFAKYKYGGNNPPKKSPPTVKVKTKNGGAFGRLLDELDAIKSGNSNKKEKQNYQ